MEESAMGGERSRTLHNFSLPPRLSWGTQKLLRCSNHAVSENPNKKRRRNAIRRVSPDEDDNQIEVMREKLILDLRSEVDKMRATILGGAPATAVEARPWNLRTRRAACGEQRPVSSPIRVPAARKESAASVLPARAEFAVELKRSEIEDDFVEMVGRRPPRKPKKRPRSVQKQMDTLFPGLWLSVVTADMYKVDENPEPPLK